MSRVRVYDAEPLAKRMVRTFKDREVEEEIVLPFGWPATMQHVGDSLATCYSSDKWQDDDTLVDYKHLSESRHRALCVPGFLRSFDSPKNRVRTIGPSISFVKVPMPKHFSELALFEEIDLAMHTSGSNEEPEFSSDPNDGVVKVTVARARLGGSYIRWSQVGKGRDQPFLFIYTDDSGPLMIIVGEKLGIERDGIVG